LKVAEEDLTTQADKAGEKYIPLSQARTRRGRQAEVVVRQNEVYLSNDKAERKASGSYYTPDPIVEYIVANTVGPVLDGKLEALRAEFRQVRRTFEQALGKAKFVSQVSRGEKDERQWAAEETHRTHRDLVERFFDLKVLDPAMGSGHFLVEAVDFITDRLLKFLNQFPINPVNIALERTRVSILQSLSEQGVTVDPATLPDINLLKRHVLKRCIYGVDLNPMAVELAKVSLWLDAFTLGAPLSFLDHHLRVGNSLVGATFPELRDATSGLFSIKYEELKRAIQHVLFVSKMADATAAEASRSAAEYADARRLLSGYRVVFDCLTARHFGLPQAVPDIVAHGSVLNLASREAFLESLTTPRDHQLVEQVEGLAQRADLRFFHWDIEFPEVFFGFVDADQRQLRHKDEIEAGSAGFDVVVGNPPYVRQEVIKPLKAYLKANYRTYDSTNDLYVYFQELEVRKLSAQGRMGMIVANKWMRAGYGENLREFLQRTGQPLEVINFGHSPIFPDADTFPCILLMTRRPAVVGDKARPPANETMAACEVPREHWNDRMDLGAFVAPRRHQIPTRLLRNEGWVLEGPQVLTLLEKIRMTGVPLEEYAGCSPLMGLKTGLNEAFLIDGATRDRLIQESRSSEEVIRPLLRGRDAARWQSRDSGCFLITIPSSENNDWPWSEAGDRAETVFRTSYPAIYNHFQPHRQALIKRQDKGRFYWELRSCDYMDEFAKPKIMWQEIQFHSWYCWDKRGSIVNNKMFFLPTKDLALVGILCSPLQWWHLTRVLPHMKDEALNPASFMMENVRISTGPQPQAQAIRETVLSLLALTERIRAFESETVQEAHRRFSLPQPDGKVVSLLPLTADVFATRLLKLAGVKPPSPKLSGEIADFHRQSRSRQVELLTRQLALERTLATLVEDAYGLDQEERALLRSTRPVRDPLDVLEAKTRGGEVEEPREDE
jgi:hypothetical protein